MHNLRTSVKTRRKELGYSLRKMAELTKSTPSNIKNFEDGKANITIALLHRICIALNCNLCVTLNNI